MRVCLLLWVHSFVYTPPTCDPLSPHALPLPLRGTFVWQKFSGRRGLLFCLSLNFFTSMLLVWFRNQSLFAIYFFGRSCTDNVVFGSNETLPKWMPDVGCTKKMSLYKGCTSTFVRVVFQLILLFYCFAWVFGLFCCHLYLWLYVFQTVNKPEPDLTILCVVCCVCVGVRNLSYY